MRRGLFVSVEGVDGAGKTDAVKRACRMLEPMGYRIVRVKTPGLEGRRGKVREAILDGPSDPAAVLALFVADLRLAWVEEIAPALEESGTIVLCDRWTDSTVVYQVETAGEVFRGGGAFLVNALKSTDLLPVPDLTLLIDVPAEVAARRVGGGKDWIECVAEDVIERRRKAYLTLADIQTHRDIVVLDGRLSKERVASHVFREIVAACVRRGVYPVKREEQEPDGVEKNNSVFCALSEDFL